MKCRIPVALALSGGYILGRTKKMKLALMVAGMAAGSRLPINPSELAKRGANALQSSEEVGKLVDLARTGLVDAGKAAAVSAASSRIEAISGRLADRAAKLDSPLGDDEPAEDEEEEPTEEDEEEDVAPKKSTPRRTRSGSRSGSGNGSGGRRTTRTRRSADNG